MIWRACWAVALLLGGCGEQSPPKQSTPGAHLEAAAIAQGLVADPDGVALTGVWARDTDRLCIVPGQGAEDRIGAVVDYGENQWCAASGTARHLGSTVRINFGACRFSAEFDGERIAFPASVPIACAAFCRGRATLDALTVTQLSQSRSEAAALVAPNRQPLCTD